MIGATLLLFIAEGAPPFEIIPDKTELPLLNPSFKDQKTLKIRLSNKLQAVIVSDPDIKQSSATLTVMAGSWYDPVEHPGLAHFLEHMLFLGTKEYPEESAFNRFLSAHGGDSNAFTHGDFTSYLFTVNSGAFPEALKRFSSFFKEPLFNSSGVNRELNAIDQEFNQGFNSDSTREYFVLKTLAEPNHPVHRFHTGNSSSLSQATRETLNNWFKTHYSAERMRLYILSPLPLEELQALVIDDFSSIEERSLELASFEMPILGEQLKGNLVRMASQNNAYTLTLYWELPKDFSQMLDSKPDDLLCYIIGHEGKESLLAQLKREDLAEELGCGSLELSSSTALFEIKIELTLKGFEKFPLVIERVFQALARLKQTPFPTSLFEEYSALLKQRYQFQQREKPYEWALKQSTWLAKEDLSTYPELSSTIRRFDPGAIQDLANSLTPERAAYFLSAPLASHQEPLSSKEPWMQIAYSRNPLPKDLLKMWSRLEPHPAIQMLTPNPFIASDLLQTKASQHLSDYPYISSPEMLLDRAGIRFYYAQDPFYQVPRTFIRFLLQSPAIQDGRPQSIVLTDLLIKALEDHLREMIYHAKMADLNVSLERIQGGIQVTLEGFSVSLEKFFSPFLKELTQYTPHENKFLLLQETQKREYENVAKEMPVKQAFDYFKAAIFQDYVINSQKRTAIGKLTYETYLKFCKNIFKETFFKGLITGSLSQQKALFLAQELDQIFHPVSSSRGLPSTPQAKSLPEQPYLVTYPTKAQGNATLLFLQVDGFSPSFRNMQQILSAALSEAFFNELRTRQQTGYIVSSDGMDFQRFLFNYFAVQSTNHTPEDLLWRFEQFLETYLRNMESAEIGEERFFDLKRSIEVGLKEPPPTLSLYGEQQFKFAFEIEDFDWMKKRLDALKSLNYEEWVSFAKKFLSRQNKRRLAILLEGQNGKDQTLFYIPLKKIDCLKAPPPKKKGKSP